MVIRHRWTEVDGERRQTVYVMDGFRRRTFKNIKIWTEVDGWTDGRKSVRRGLALTFAKCKSNILYITSEINQEWNISLAQLVLAELTRCCSELTGQECH